MKGLFSLTLAASLMASVGAFAQSESVAESVPPCSLAPDAQVAKISGKTFRAADGSKLTILAYQGGMAREIDRPNGAVEVEVFALQTAKDGTISEGDSANAPSGTFQVTASGVAANFGDGRSEEWKVNAAGNLTTVTAKAEGQVERTAWFADGHRFSSGEVEAALTNGNMAVASNSIWGLSGDVQVAQAKPHHSHRAYAAAPRKPVTVADADTH